MKKRTLFRMLALTLAMIFTLAACGGKKESSSGSKNSGGQKPGQSSGDDDWSDMFDDDDWADMFGDDRPDDTQQSASGSADPALRLYNRVSEWDNVTIEDMPIQICDVLYYPGTSVADFVKMAEKSAVDYTVQFKITKSYSDPTYEPYNADALTSTREWKSVYFSVGETRLFYIEAYNVYSETTSVKDLPVLAIVPEPDVFPYCRFFDGTKTYADIVNLSYSDMPALQLYLEELGYFFYEQSGNSSDIVYHIDYHSPSDSNAGIFLRRAVWTDQYIILKTIPSYFINIDKNTSKVTDFTPNNIYMCYLSYESLANYPGPKPETLADINNLDAFIQSLEDEILSDHPDYVINERIGTVIGIRKTGGLTGSEHFCILTIYRVNDSQYTPAYIDNNAYSNDDVWTDYWGNVQYRRSIWTQDAYDSLEALLENFTFIEIYDCDSEMLRSRMQPSNND